MTDGPPRETRRTPGKRAAIALAIAVHLALAVFLIYGIRWQTKATDVVEVDLVPGVTPSAPAKVGPPPPPPAPQPTPKPEPKVEPKPAPPPPVKPDIVVKDKEKPKPVKEEPRRPSFLDSINDELKQLTSRKSAEEQAREKAAQDAAQATAARGKAVASYVDRIRGKIRGNIVLPPDLQGNPVARFHVVQLPSGEIVGDPRLVKSSGVGAYDAAVDRAIRKSSPLPKPDDPSLFSRELDLTFCPQESGCN